MTPQEYALLKQIADRAAAANPIWKSDRMGLMMDLEFTNNIIPLDFEGLGQASNFDFIHDISGIYSHFNRETKTMDGLFVPRFAKYSDDPIADRSYER